LRGGRGKGFGRGERVIVSASEKGVTEGPKKSEEKRKSCYRHEKKKKNFSFRAKSIAGKKGRLVRHEKSEKGEKTWPNCAEGSSTLDQ